jgi:hypothetical protein
MFMRFRGGGVGHLGTRHLDSRLKDNGHKSGDGHQEEARDAEEISSHPHDSEKRRNGIQEESESEEEGTGQREANNNAPVEDEEDEDENENEGVDEDEDEDEDEDRLGDIVDKGEGTSRNMDDDGQDEDEDEEAIDDDEILEEEGYAEL